MRLTSNPTGIAQFDFDVQDNEDADFDTPKQPVTTIPECINVICSNFSKVVNSIIIQPLPSITTNYVRSGKSAAKAT